MSPRPRLDHTVGIVLVGTHPWTNTTFDRLPPRPLLPVAHRPLISYALAWLRDGGIRDAAVCANRETQVLQSRLQRHVPDGLDVSYYEDAMPRGAAGALRDAALSHNASVFVVADGTAIPHVDITELLASHHRSEAMVTVVSHREASRDGRSSQVPSGIYVFNREALEVVPDRGFYDIKENLIPYLYRNRQRVAVFAVDKPCPRVLDLPTYRAVNAWMVDHLVASRAIPDGYVLSRGCLCHRDASIARDATLVGPILIGPGARIGPGAVIVGPTSIGADAEIGSRVLLSRATVWRRAQIFDDAVADRVVLADDSIVAAGSRVYHQIVMPRPSRVRRHDREAAWTVSETPSLDILRRVSRAVFGTDGWSRSPAAQ
jgi:mannose-1-phosphate guanylyltransferase / phosphomannomutase